MKSREFEKEREDEWVDVSVIANASISYTLHTLSFYFWKYKWIFKIDKIKANTNTFETY